MAGYDPLSNLPNLQLVDNGTPQRGNWFTSGIKTGGREALAQLAGAVQAGATAVGADQVAQQAAGKAAYQRGQIQQINRPDLEQNPWSLAGMGYQVAKALPAMGGMLAAGLAVPEAAIPAALARVIPGGAAAARGAVGAFGAGYPLSVGSNVETATEGGKHPLSQGQAAKALALGVPEAAVGAVIPGRAHKVLEAGAEGALGRRVATGMGVFGVLGAAQGAVNTALNQEMSPTDMSIGDRARQVVDSALSGGFVGGLLGGGVHALSRKAPTPNDLRSSVDGALQNAGIDVPGAEPPRPPPAPPSLPEYEMGFQQRMRPDVPYTREPPPVPQAPIEPPDFRSRFMNGADTGEAGSNTKLRPLTPGVDENGQLTFTSTPVDDLRAAAADEKNPLGGMAADELATRANPNAQGELFTPEQMGERLPQIKDMRERLAGELQAAGIKGKQEPLLNRVPATNEPELVNWLTTEVNDRVESGQTIPKGMLALAERYGVSTLDGGNRDLPAERAVVQQQIDQLWAKAKASPEGSKQEAKYAADAQKAQERAAELDQLQEWHAQAETMRDPNTLREAPPTVTEANRDVWSQMDRIARTEEDPTLAAMAGRITERLEKGGSGDKTLLDARYVENILKEREAANAVQEFSPEGLDVREPPRDGEAVGGTHPERDAASEAIPGTEEGVILDGTTPYWKQLDEAGVDVGFHKGRRVLQGGESDELAQLRATQEAETAARTKDWLDRPVDSHMEVLQKQAAMRDNLMQLMNAPDAPEALKRIADKALNSAEPFALRDALRAIDVAAQKAAGTSDGPWTGGKESVIGTDSIPQGHIDYVRDLMNTLGLGKVRVLLAHPDDLSPLGLSGMGANGEYSALRYANGVTNPAGEVLGHVRSFGPDQKDFYIHMPEITNGALDVERLSHEVGHIIEKVAFRNASEGTRNKVMAAFEDFLKRTSGMPAQDFIRALRNRKTAEESVKNLDPNMLASDLPNADYWRSFGEWFADNVSRWATSAEKPKSAMEKFFASVAERLKQLVAYITGSDYAPDKAVSTFLNRMRADIDNARKWQGEADQKAQFLITPEDDRGPKTIPDMNAATSRALVGAEALKNAAIANGLGPREIGNRMHRAILGFMGMRELDAQYSKIVPEISDLYRVDQLSDRVRNRFHDGAQSVSAPIAELVNLGKPGRKALDDFTRLAQLTASGIDPRKTWAEHPWLHSDKQAEQLRGLHTEAAATYQRLKQAVGPDGKNLGVAQMFDNAALYNGMDWMRRAAVSTHDLMQHFYPTETAGTVFEAHPVEQALNMGLDRDIAAQHAYWDDVITKQQTTLDALVNRATGEAATLPAVEAKSLMRSMEDAVGLRADLNTLRASMKQAPYFRLGREGDHFVKGTLKAGADGYVDPKALQTLSEKLSAAGFKNFAFEQVAGNPDVYIRMATADQRVAARRIFDEVAGQKLIGDVADGTTSDLSKVAGIMPEHTRKMIERIAGRLKDTEYPGASPADAARYRAQTLEQLAQIRADLLPTRSIHRMLTERENVQGASTDFVRHFEDRAMTGINALAATMTGPLRDHYSAQIRNRVEAARRAGDPNTMTMENLANELIQRDLTKIGVSRQNSVYNTLRSYMHTFALGASVPYMILETSQVPLLGFPELAKTHGFKNAFGSLTSTTTTAFKAVKAVFESGDRLQPQITRDALEKAGLPKNVVDTLVAGSNAGWLDTGGRTFNYGSTPTENRAALPAKVKNFANAFPAYVELFTRVQMALAAAHAYDSAPHKANGVPRDTFIEKAVTGSMFDWQTGSTARQLGPGGFAGQATPLLTQFHSFQVKAIAKLYQEFSGLASGDKATRDASLRWLGGHAAAAVMLSGSLGLPFLQGYMGAFDKLANTVTNRDDWDIESAYRGFLSDTFGKGVGEVLAKGLPRAVGLDTSEVGLAKLGPFSEFLSDKQKFTDAIGDMMMRTAGATAGQSIKLVDAARDFYNGQYLHGWEKIIPGALKGLTDAAVLATHGYENSRYEKLPIEPTGADIAMRAIGLKPADKAQYEEAADAARGLKEQRDQRRSNIGMSLATAIERGNQRDISTWLDEALKFDQEHPGQPSLPSLAGMLQQRAVAPATARGLGMPLGVSPRDLVTQNAIRWR